MEWVSVILFVVNGNIFYLLSMMDSRAVDKERAMCASGKK